MELKWLEDLVALLEEQSFSRAAARRNITQSAFSRRIQSLEDWFGCKLVDRSTKPIRLLNNSYVVGPHIWSLVNQFYQLRTQLKLNNAATEKVTFAIQDALGVSVFPSIVNKLTDEVNSRRPAGASAGSSFAFKLDSREKCVKQLEHAEADFMICYENDKQKVSLSGKSFKKIAWQIERFIPVASKPIFDMLAKAQTSESAIPFIAYPVDSFFGNTIAASSQNDSGQNFNLERVCEAESEVVIREMVRSGHGMTWLPHSVVVNDLEAGDIIDLSNRLPHYEFDVVIYSNALAPMSQHIFELLRDIKDRQPGA